MSTCDISGSVRIQDGVAACAECGSTSRVGRGFCLNCMLRRGLGCETETTETLEEVLDEIDVRDADWRIGNYQILEEIGRGGMGVIYRARQRHSRRIVAVKRILSYQAESQETLVRFRREAEAAASLDHPNILPIYEVSESDDGLPFFSMKFAAGGSLLDAARGLRSDPRRIIALMAKVTRAVQFAHLHGILHRDLKPGNILLDGRGEPLVSDFGLAKWLDTSSDLTRTLTIFGTPGYIAPEQAHGPAKHLTPAADIYSIGAVLFDLFTGRTPFLGEHALAVIKQASEKAAPKLRTLAPLADRDVETICAKCLEREPQARYRSAGDLAQDLERWLEGRPIIARPVSPPVRIWRWSKRNPKFAGSLIICVLLAVVVGASAWKSRAAARAANMAKHSVVVEPLLDLDSAKPDYKLSRNIAKTLRQKLSRYGPARVAASATRANHAFRPQPLPTRPEEARFVVQGTKRSRDGRTRVALRFINRSDGKIVFRELIEDGSDDNPMGGAADLTGSQIYGLLDHDNPPSTTANDLDPGWKNAEARELLITGRAVMERRTLIDIDRAIELFRKAIELEPRSAMALSFLSEVQAARAGITGDPKSVAAGIKSARAALAADAQNSEGHKALCLALYQQGLFQDSLEEAFIAYEFADSEDDRLPSRVAANLETMGRLAEAVAWYRLALGKGYRPGDNEYALADCLAELTSDDEAAAIYRRFSSLFPELPQGWIGLCRLALLQRNGALARKICSENAPRYRDFLSAEEMEAQVAFFLRDFDQAERIYHDLVAKNPDGGGEFLGAITYQSALGRLCLEAHDQKTGLALLRSQLEKETEILRSAPRHPGALYRIATTAASLGDRDRAITNLRLANHEGWRDYRSAELDPRFDPVCEDTEFQQLIQTMKNEVEIERRNVPAP